MNLTVNQPTAPSFKQLRIIKSPELVNTLKSQHPETIKSIQEAGNILKDTKFFDVVLSCFPKTNCIHAKLVSSSKAYFGKFKSEKFKNVIITEKNSINLDDKYRVYRNIDDFLDPSQASYEVVRPNKMVLCGLKSVKKLSNIAIELDNAAISEYNKKIEAGNARALYERASNKQISELLINFGE